MLSVRNRKLCGCDYALRAVKEKLPPGASQSILVLGSKNVFHVEIYKKGDGCSTYFHRTGQTGSDSLETKMVPTNPKYSSKLWDDNSRGSSQLIMKCPAWSPDLKPIKLLWE